MFDSLSNLMKPKPQNLKAQPSTSNELPRFDIEPVDFETIDNSALIDYFDQNEQILNEMINQTNQENKLVPAKLTSQQVLQKQITNQKTNNYQINNIQNRQASSTVLSQLKCHYKLQFLLQIN